MLIVNTQLMTFTNQYILFFLSIKSYNLKLSIGLTLTLLEKIILNLMIIVRLC